MDGKDGMLVLTRYEGESIVIGDDIIVTVVRVDQGKVRLGIKAPRCIMVDRLEVRKEKEERSANREQARFSTPPTESGQSEERQVSAGPDCPG